MVKNNERLFVQEAVNHLIGSIDGVLKNCEETSSKRSFLFHLSGYILVEWSKIEDLQDILKNILDASAHVESQLNKGDKSGKGNN